MCVYGFQGIIHLNVDELVRTLRHFSIRFVSEILATSKYYIILLHSMSHFGMINSVLLLNMTLAFRFMSSFSDIRMYLRNTGHNSA